MIHTVGTMCRNLFIFFFLWGSSIGGQKNLVHYEEFQKKYSQFSENDTRALSALRKSIQFAKSSKNFRHLTYTYEDAVYYSPLKTDKLKYADSTINASLKTKDSDLISKAYLGKGIVYYFNFRDYRNALPLYLLAARFAEKNADPYLLNKIKYHMGIVKTYLGYHHEALIYFTECNFFFRNHLDPTQSANLQFNYTRGYLNTLHQLIINYRQLKNEFKVDSLLYLTVPYRNISEFQQEKGYFLKEKGIVSFNKKSYRLAIDTLTYAAKIITQKNEELPLAVTYFYIGNAHLKMGNTLNAVTNLKKVDSLFNLQQIIFPELRTTYELLLETTDIEKYPQKALYYTGQILKVDSILTRDFPLLSTLITREYDNKTILTERLRILQTLNNENNKFYTGMILATLLILSLIIYLFLRKTKNTFLINLLINSFCKNNEITTDAPSQIQKSTRKTDYNAESVYMILEKLETFEQTLGFIKKDLSLRSLAKSFKTNTTHLSYVINEYKHMNFNAYLKVLRINYITRLLNVDKKYLNYTVEALAEECGINSRQQFSNQFFEINAKRPADFIAEQKVTQHKKQ